MKILFCNKYNFAFSGTEVYMFEAMDLMRSRGHEVALFSMADTRGKATPYDHHFVAHTDFKGGHHGVIEQGKLVVHAIYSSEARDKLRGLIRDFRPDVAHVRNIYHHLSPSVLWELRAQGVPVVYHLNDFKLLCPSYNMVSHGHACEQCRGGQYWRVLTEGCYQGRFGAGAVLAAEAYFHRWLHTYEKCIDRFLAPSQFVKQKLIENGWPAARIDVLPHFQRLPAEPTAAAATDAPILYFGRLSSEKGLVDLLRAMRRLPRIRLQIAGNGPQQEELQRFATQWQLDNVEFLGHLTGADLDRAITSCCISILPSHAYETMGKSILESYARGRPVIASDLGSRRELVKEGRTGLLFPPGNCEQLAGAISFLYDRPPLVAEMGAAGLELVRKHHSPEAHCIALNGIYRELAASRKPRALVSVTAPKLQVAFIGGRGVISKYSGIEAYYEEVGKQLAAMGHDVTVYCRNYFTPSQQEHRGMRIVRLPTIRTKHLETLVHTSLSTAHVLFSSCNIVHYHALGPALFSFIPRMFGKRTVVTVQGLDWQRKKWGPVAAAVLRLGEEAAFRLPSATMVVSRTLEQYYRTEYGASAIYVPNGATIRGRTTVSHLNHWGLESDKYVLYLGRLSPEKNCHLLVEAYEKIHTDVKLVLAGGSSYTDSYIEALRQHQGDRIRFLNWVSGEALDELLTHAMLFVLPSDLEGLSLALLDAMGAGVCVLTSDIPENREVVDGAGFTFRRGDATDLERMLRLLISDPEVRESAARSARERVRERYLWPQIAQDIEKAYWKLIGWPRQVESIPEHTPRQEPKPAPQEVA